MVYMYRYHGSSTVQLSIYSRYILCEDKFGARAPTRGRLTVKMGDTKLQEMPTVVITTMLIGLVLIAIGRKLGWLHTGTPAPPPPTEKWEPKRPSDKDLAVQEARCQEVKARSLDAAGRIKKAFRNGEDVETITAVAKALDELVAVYDENMQAGAVGAIAMTELCNALLETDTLDVLNKLQQHTDANISARSTELFQQVIPRIWSF